MRWMLQSLSKNSRSSSGCAFHTTKKLCKYCKVVAWVSGGDSIVPQAILSGDASVSVLYALELLRTCSCRASAVHVWLYQRSFRFRWKVTLFSIFKVLLAHSGNGTLAYFQAFSSQIFCSNSWICVPEFSTCSALLLPSEVVKLGKFFLSLNAINWRNSCNLLRTSNIRCQVYAFLSMFCFIRNLICLVTLHLIDGSTHTVSMIRILLAC